MVLEILIYLGGETYLSGREGCYRICWRCWKVLFVLKEQMIGNGNRRRNGEWFVFGFVNLHVVWKIVGLRIGKIDGMTLRITFLVIFGKLKLPPEWLSFLEKLLLDRIPTKSNLIIHNILPLEDLGNCVLCDFEGENATHLFLFCEVTSRVWKLVMRWLDFIFITPPNLFVHLECWSNEAVNEKIRQWYWLIWQATIWAIWNACNSRIFNNTVKAVQELAMK